MQREKSFHILFLTGWYPSKILPTNGDFIQRHAEAIATRHRVSVVHVISDPEATQDISISDESLNGVRTLIAYIKPGNGKILRFAKAYRKLMAKAGDYDLIHVNILYPAGIIALWQKISRRIPYIITEHHSFYAQKNIKTGFIRKWISRRISRNAAFICPVSRFLARSMQQSGLNGNYRIIPNVVNTGIFHPDGKPNNDRSPFRILHVSNMNEVKNPAGIMRVFGRLIRDIPDVEITLIGMTEERLNTYLEAVDIRRERLRHITEIPQEELAEHYRNSHLSVLFSHTETQALVVQESFACGTPVVAPYTGGIPEYFPPDFGILVPPGDEEALYRAIVEVYSHKHSFAGAQEMFRFVQENFSGERIARAYSGIYSQIIKPVQK